MWIEIFQTKLEKRVNINVSHVVSFECGIMDETKHGLLIFLLNGGHSFIPCDDSLEAQKLYVDFREAIHVSKNSYAEKTGNSFELQCRG